MIAMSAACEEDHLNALTPLLEVRLCQFVDLDGAHAGSASVHDASLS